MTPARLHTYLGGLTGLVIILALVNWNIMPESANSWMAAMITMAFIWLIATVKMKVKAGAKLNEMEQKFFNSSVILAGLLLSFSLAARLTGHAFDLETSLIDRARNVFSGFVLLYFANLLPKLIGPALNARCSNITANSVRRFAGWALVFGAIGYIGAWIFAPITQTSNIAHACVGIAIVLVGVRIGFAVLGQRRTQV